MASVWRPPRGLWGAFAIPDRQDLAGVMLVGPLA